MQSGIIVQYRISNTNHDHSSLHFSMQASAPNTVARSSASIPFFFSKHNNNHQHQHQNNTHHAIHLCSFSWKSMRTGLNEKKEHIPPVSPALFALTSSTLLLNVQCNARSQIKKKISSNKKNKKKDGVSFDVLVNVHTHIPMSVLLVKVPEKY